MADLKDFHEGESRRLQIEEIIKNFKAQGFEKHKEQDEKVIEISLSMMPFILQLLEKKESGESLSAEEEDVLEKLIVALKKITDYMTLSNAARFERLLDTANTYYYHVKKLALEGDKNAEKVYLELKKLKENQLNNDLKTNEN